MIGWIKGIFAKKKRARIVKNCRENGHFLKRTGELSPADQSGAATGPAEFWLMGCVCGYTEVQEIESKPMRRSFEDGERMIKEQSKK